MIYLNAEVISGLGEDTFWTWFHREFPTSSFKVPKVLNDDDILLRYSTLGFLPIVGKQVSLCWELYLDMKEEFSTTQWDPVIDKVKECARYSTYRTVATDSTTHFYEEFGSVDIIPIGVDTDLFKPLQNKENLRKKYNIPIEKKVGIWVGTNHPMKGYSDLIQYAKNHPDIYWIVVWKSLGESTPMPNASNFVRVKQSEMVELMGCADFFLSCSRLKPFYMVEWEAMSCNLPMVIIGKSPKDFVPSSQPRNDVFRLGWDRKSLKKKWEKYLIERGVKW